MLEIFIQLFGLNATAGAFTLVLKSSLFSTHPASELDTNKTNDAVGEAKRSFSENIVENTSV